MAGCFGCLSGSPRLGKEDKPLIIDVEQVIADAAWDMYLHSLGKCQRKCLRRKNFRIEVPMNYYSFEQLQQKFIPRKRRAGAVDAGCGNGPSSSLLEGRALAHRDETSPEHMGLETVFKNDTATDQTYNFRFEKVRKATISVNYQKGYSFGGKANFSLGLPKVLSDGSAGLEMDMHVSVSKTTGETFEETLTTSASSEIKVGANSHYTASVVMEERSLTADFVLDVIMCMPAKRAPVYIKHKKTGDQVFVYSLNNLPDLFEDYPDVSRVKDEQGNVRADAVQFTIEGKVDGMQLSNHVINLTGRKLPGAEGKKGEKTRKETEGKEGATGGEGAKEGQGSPVTAQDNDAA